MKKGDYIILLPINSKLEIKKKEDIVYCKVTSSEKLFESVSIEELINSNMEKGNKEEYTPNKNSLLKSMSKLSCGSDNK